MDFQGAALSIRSRCSVRSLPLHPLLRMIGEPNLDQDMHTFTVHGAGVISGVSLVLRYTYAVLTLTMTHTDAYAFAYIDTCIHVHAYMHTYTCTYSHTRTYTHIHMHTNTNTHQFTHKFTHTFTYTHIPMHTHKILRTCTYTHTHTADAQCTLLSAWRSTVWLQPGWKSHLVCVLTLLLLR